MIKVVLPKNLQILAGVGRVVELEVTGPATQRAVLDALEASHPSLLGTVRDQVSKKRRPMVRFFACEEDLSDESPDAPLPEEVASGKEPFLIIGAIAGGSAADPGAVVAGGITIAWGWATSGGSCGAGAVEAGAGVDAPA